MNLHSMRASASAPLSETSPKNIRRIAGVQVAEKLGRNDSLQLNNGIDKAKGVRALSVCFATLTPHRCLVIFGEVSSGQPQKNERPHFPCSGEEHPIDHHVAGTPKKS